MRVNSCWMRVTSKCARTETANGRHHAEFQRMAPRYPPRISNVYFSALVLIRAPYACKNCKFLNFNDDLVALSFRTKRQHCSKWKAGRVRVLGTICRPNPLLQLTSTFATSSTPPDLSYVDVCLRCLPAYLHSVGAR